MDTTVLVTGGSGFVGIHTIVQLMRKGYRVHTTVRSSSRKEDILTALQSEEITTLENLRFFEADLTREAGWREAMEGVRFVLHVASPFPARDPEDENELIIPAREGALRVLRTARDAGVERVVLTSSFAAVGYSKDSADYVFTEEDWTDALTPLPAYIKSKTLAEKAAWDFMNNEGGDLELVVINPVGIFGPVIGGISSASLDIAVSGILNGTTSQSPDFTMGIVDVRDVASLHIIAMEHPEAAGERFIACADGDAMSFYDVAALFRKERPELAGKIATMQPTSPEFYKKISNHKAKTLLAWQPLSREQALLDSADSLVK